jgi:hypothetical protein
MNERGLASLVAVSHFVSKVLALLTGMTMILMLRVSKRDAY